MKKLVRTACCIVFLLTLALVTSSCSNILDRIRGRDTPKTQTKTTPPKTQTPKPTVAKPKEPVVAAKDVIKKGNVQRVSGDYVGAIASFEQALEIEPDNAEAKKLLQETTEERDKLVDEHMKQGVQYYTEENLQAAMQEWNKVLELDPSNKKAAEYKEITQKKLDALQ